MTWASQCWDHARCLDLQDHGITVPVRLPSKEAIGKWLPAEVANCLCDGIDLPDSVMGESRLGNFEGFNMEREVCCLLQCACQQQSYSIGVNGTSFLRQVPTAMVPAIHMCQSPEGA